MKNLILTLLFFISFSASSQTTYTEKWNSAYQRYEYRDSSGNLVGYKKWNSAYERWEYTELKQKSNSYQVEQPVQRGNIDLDYKILQQKQERYNANLSRINTEFDSYAKYIYVCGYDYTAQQRDNAYKKLVNSYNHLVGIYDISLDSNANYIIKSLALKTFEITCSDFNKNCK